MCWAKFICTDQSPVAKYLLMVLFDTSCVSSVVRSGYSIPGSMWVMFTLINAVLSGAPDMRQPS